MIRTYPIYEATFGGSSDHMARVSLKVAAVNTSQALKRFREWDAGTTGLRGMIGNLIYKDKEHGWFRPAEITSEHIRRVTDIRATRKDWYIL